MPAPKGNKHAQKGVHSRDAMITVRIDTLTKSQAREHAESLNLSLSDWIVRLIKSDMGIK